MPAIAAAFVIWALGAACAWVGFQYQHRDEFADAGKWRAAEERAMRCRTNFESGLSFDRCARQDYVEAKKLEDDIKRSMADVERCVEYLSSRDFDPTKMEEYCGPKGGVL